MVLAVLKTRRDPAFPKRLTFLLNRDYRPKNEMKVRTRAVLAILQNMSNAGQVSKAGYAIDSWTGKLSSKWQL